MKTPERSTRRPLDMAALHRISRRMLVAPQAPWLHGEVARRMVERLPIVKLQPQRVVDWGAFVGGSTPALRSAYPQAEYLAVEPDEVRRLATVEALAQPWWSPGRWVGPACEVALPVDVAPGHGQLLWSNMVLQGAIDPQQTMQDWHRALAVDGFLMFSTLGPGTLVELTALYRAAGWAVPFAPFVDMHDLGDMLIHAGFADPVMDQELVTLTWPSAAALLLELRGLGGNASPARFGALRTRRWRQELFDRLQARAAPDGRVALSFEVIYGHAFRPPPRPRLQAETTLPLADLRAMVRTGRRSA